MIRDSVKTSVALRAQEWTRQVTGRPVCEHSVDNLSARLKGIYTLALSAFHLYHVEWFQSNPRGPKGSHSDINDWKWPFDSLCARDATGELTSERVERLTAGKQLFPDDNPWSVLLCRAWDLAAQLPDLPPKPRGGYARPAGKAA